MDKEFEIIKKYFKPLAKNQESLNLQNDAAFIKDKNLVVSTDMMVEGIHFYKNDKPEEISRKLLRINLSDIAAMGAKPYGFFLNIALPKLKHLLPVGAGYCTTFTQSGITRAGHSSFFLISPNITDRGTVRP